MGSYRFILSGGGTGGHIYPAIAIANELKRRYPDAEFLFVGAQDRMEMEKVPQAGYTIEGLWISGLQRKLSLKNLMFPIKLISSLIKARNILAKFKPDAVIGTGGFASGPLVQMATRKKIPVVIQEQNSYAGITNKLLGKKADKICVAYDDMDRFFPLSKIVKTGNPVRKELVHGRERTEAVYNFFQLDAAKPVLLVLGGSLGAGKINEFIKEQLSFFEAKGIQVIWQCGKLYFETYSSYTSDTVKVYDFLNKMDYAYAAADYIISRAGAGSVSELCIVGKPVIFIPSPNVSEDHQTKNAQALVDRKAAIMIREKDLQSEFVTVFSQLVASEKMKVELSHNIIQLALPNATDHIVDEIENLILKGVKAQ